MAVPVYQLELRDRANDLVLNLAGKARQVKGAYRLNRPTVWTFTIPAGHVAGNHTDGYRKLCTGRRCLRVYRTPSTGGSPVLIFNGIVWYIEAKGDRNQASWEVKAIDPMVWWRRRWVRDADGSLVNLQWDSPITAAGILLSALENSVSNAGDVGDQEGPLGLEIDSGNFDTDTGSFPDMSAFLGDAPITIAQLATTLMDTGRLDVRINPVAGSPYDDDVMGEIEARAEISTDLTGSVSFDYGTGQANVEAARYIEDADTMANKLWSYFGPKIDETHWKGLITADDPDLPDPPQTSLAALITDSRDAYGVFMDIDVWDVPGTAVTGTSQYRRMFERLWQTKQLLRVKPRELYFFTPKAGGPHLPFEDYREGDLVAGNTAAEALGVELTDVAMRVYGFDVQPADQTGAETMGEMLVSADQE